jgi:sensor histidine kinase YesM
MFKFLDCVNPYKKIWHFWLANLVISFAVMMLFYSGWNQSFKHFYLSLLWSFSICVTQWVGHGYINYKLSERFPWQGYPLQRSILGAIATIIYAVFAYLLVQFIMMRLINGQLPENPLQWALKSSIYAISISFGISLIFTAMGFFKSWKKSLLEAEQFKTQMLAYKYEALQNQINPHFLFNSFNVLTDLVYDDPKKAVNFIKQLSQLFRYILDNREKELVPIADELEFLKSYTFLLKTRFENKLTLNLNLDSQPNELIVPMALQLLIENCVKHNEISTAKPLTIKVERVNDYIEVSNNYQFKNVGNDSKKTGLTNIKQQYSFFTNKELIIESNSEIYRVKIPIIKAEEK